MLIIAIPHQSRPTVWQVTRHEYRTAGNGLHDLHTYVPLRAANTYKGHQQEAVHALWRDRKNQKLRF